MQYREQYFYFMSFMVCDGKADGWGTTAMVWVGTAIFLL